MECKCFVNGCTEPVSLIWHLDSSITYSCSLHKILENNRLGQSNPYDKNIPLNIPRPSIPYPHLGPFFILMFIIPLFSAVFYHIFHTNKESFKDLSNQISILSDQNNINYRFYSEILEIRNLLENNDKKIDKNLINSAVAEISSELDVFSLESSSKSLTKREAMIALTGNNLPLSLKLDMAIKNFGLYFENIKSEMLTISFVTSRQILAGSMGGVITSYNFTTHEYKRIFKGKPRVYAIAPSKDLTTAIVTGDSNINILNLKKMVYMKSFLGHGHWILTTIISEDNSIFITGSCDKLIRVWNHNTLEMIYELSGHSGDIWSLSLSRDKKLLVSGGEDKVIILWDLNSLQILKKFTQQLSPIYAVTMTQDQKTIVSGASDKTIFIWNIETGKYNVLLHDGMVRSLALVNNDKHLIACGGIYVKVWEMSSLNIVHSLKHIDTLISVSVSPNMMYIVSGDVSNRLWIWDLYTGKLLWVFGGFIGDVEDVRLSNDMKFLILAEKGLVRIWNTQTQLQVAVFQSAGELKKWPETDLSNFTKYLYKA
ncbi:hypothetical protein SteCoe_21002 [Stentor coeruleus]|uniref:Uncharacterized protein n=1 Tax=Stentor coeruleus TaxID=5963 RepID=A0A1R2BQP9_9CILI|nr:hypothetical protein SteCoe_21002 [Stentor coeruleus]